MPPKKANSNNNDNSVQNSSLEVKQDPVPDSVNPTKLTQQPVIQNQQPSNADIMNAILGLTSRIEKLEQRQDAADAKFNHIINGANVNNSSDFQTPARNINASKNNNAGNISPTSTASTIEINSMISSSVNGNISINGPSTQSTAANKSAILSYKKSLVDKDLHPILNTKLELDVATAPKLGKSLTADEYINWYNKLKDIVLANPRFMFLFNNPIENAWKLCGGESWTKKLSDDDLDLYRWESSFINSIRSLFTYISRLVPDDILRGIKLHMVKDRGKYNIVTRLGFRSNVVLQLDSSLEPFYQDVYEFMQLLEQRYNTKDCNRIVELMKLFNGIRLEENEHPQTIFMKYQEIVTRIKAVYSSYQEQSESWMCFDILMRLPKMYDDAVKELFRLDIKSLKRDDVMKRLIAEYAQNNHSRTTEEDQIQEGKVSTDSSFGLEKQSESIAAAGYTVERICFKCGKVGHMMRVCPQKKSQI